VPNDRQTGLRPTRCDNFCQLLTNVDLKCQYQQRYRRYFQPDEKPLNLIKTNTSRISQKHGTQLALQLVLADSPFARLKIVYFMEIEK